MNTKELITITYKQLVINKKNTKVTVKELCETIHISRTTFYKYFRDTYQIMESILVDEGIYTLKTLLDAGLDSYSVTEAWYINFYKNKELYYYAIKDETQNSLFNTLINRLTEFNCKIYKEMYPIEFVEDYAYKYASMQAMLLKKWILDGMKLSPKEMTNIFLHDIRSNSYQRNQSEHK